MADVDDPPRTIGLPDLIERHKGARSFVTLQRDAGGTPNATAFHDYATGKRVPDPKNVDAIAAALRVPPEEVWVAIGVSLGFVTDRTHWDSTPALIAALGELPVGRLHDEEVRAIVTIVRALCATPQGAMTVLLNTNPELLASIRDAQAHPERRVPRPDH